MKVKSLNQNLLISDTNYTDFKPSEFISLSQEYGSKTIVLHDDNLKKYLKEIGNNFKNEYFVQLGFTANVNDIFMLGHKENKNLAVKDYEINDDAFVDIKYSYESEKNQLWYKYIPKFIHEENLNYLKRELDKSRLLTLKDDSGKIIAITMIFNSQYYTGEVIDQIGWIWISNTISREIKDEAHYKVSKWFKDNLSKKFYQAGIHIENIRSQKFFEKMGFRVQCAHITKR